MNRLYDVQMKTEQILLEHPASRDSDDVLYYHFVKEINPNISAQQMLLNREALGLPSYETVRRARQKLQEKREDLRGTLRIRNLRKEKEVEFLDFARNG